MGKRKRVLIRVIPLRNRLENAYVNKEWGKIVATIEWMSNPSNWLNYANGNAVVELPLIRNKLKTLKKDDWDRIDKISKWLGSIETPMKNCRKTISTRHVHIRKACKRMGNIPIRKKRNRSIRIINKQTSPLLQERIQTNLLAVLDDNMSNLKNKENGLFRESTGITK